MTSIRTLFYSLPMILNLFLIVMNTFELRQYSLLFLTAVIWGSGFIGQKLGMDHVSLYRRCFSYSGNNFYKKKSKSPKDPPEKKFPKSSVLGIFFLRFVSHCCRKFSAIRTSAHRRFQSKFHHFALRDLRSHYQCVFRAKTIFKNSYMCNFSCGRSLPFMH